MTRPLDRNFPVALHDQPVEPETPQIRLAPPPPARTQTSLMRKFEVLSLLPNGDTRSSHHIAPATPLFENCATAFARGTLIQTTQGPMAIEDMLPGDLVECVDADPAKVLWIGSTMMVPSAPGQAEHMRHLVRIMSDSFGIGRPMPDLLLGPAARLLQDKHAYHLVTGNRRLFLPVLELADGMGLIEVTPPSPVRVYHIALERHAAIRAAGLAVESYHPGEYWVEGVGQNMMNLFLSLFPHISKPEDFGPLAYPQTTRDILDSLSAA